MMNIFAFNRHIRFYFLNPIVSRDNAMVHASRARAGHALKPESGTRNQQPFQPLNGSEY